MILYKNIFMYKKISMRDNININFPILSSSDLFSEKYKFLKQKFEKYRQVYDYNKNV